MANVFKMSTPNVSSPAQAVAIHKVLPPELRLHIYKMAFQGAKVEAVLALEDEPFGGKHEVLHLRHSPHFNLLRSCREIHNEALPMYWSETTLNLVQPYTWPPGKLCQWAEDSHYGADYYSYHLCRSLPEVAKANVKHVRGMRLAPLHGDFVKNNPQLTPTTMLGSFKSFATCDISPTMLSHPDIPYIGTNIFRGCTLVFNNNNAGVAENDQPGPPIRSCGPFKTSWNDAYYEPKDLLRKICGIDATAEVVFLVKKEWATLTLQIRGWRAEPEPTPPSDPQTVKQFWNVSTGVFCEVDGNEVGDEEGYDMVMTPGFL